MTTQPPPAPTGSRPGRVLRHPLTIAAEIAAILALIVGIAAFVQDRETRQKQPGATPTADAAGAREKPPPSGRPADDVTYLEALKAQEGGGHLTSLPRALQDQPGYDHPVVVSCPTNQSDDKVREVTYPLRRRYLSFTATVRTHSEPADDGPVEVTAVVGTRQRDGTLSTVEEGKTRATASDPRDLVASVDGADELTLQVRCEIPDSVVVLVAPRLTPA